MNSEEYLKLSKETLASQDLEQRKIARYVFHDLSELAWIAAVCDKDKREIFYKDSAAQDRLEKNIAEVIKIQDKINKLKSDKVFNQNETDLIHALLGTGSEIGELIEAVLNFIVEKDGSFLDNVNIKEEVGDILWYLAILCRYCGFTFDDAMQANIKKLNEKRYKNGFSTDAAKNRNLDEERKAIE